MVIKNTWSMVKVGTCTLKRVKHNIMYTGPRTTAGKHIEHILQLKHILTGTIQILACRNVTKLHKTQTVGSNLVQTVKCKTNIYTLYYT